MKLTTAVPFTQTSIERMQIEVPFGLIGLANLRRFELTFVEGGWPFVQMKSIADEELSFLAIDPRGVIPGYEIEINSDDSEALDLSDADDALIYNIATVYSSQPQHVTVNLIGPVVVNRRTLIGKQVIIANSDKYSTMHPLIDDRQAHAA
ncbi:MAG: flagellar assembly protein FliW [Chthoniobacter sp.]|nr:flagellar assembly protein FliW [Chthoniobacter sp.]